jgi:hypothetical protein
VGDGGAEDCGVEWFDGDGDEEDDAFREEEADVDGVE